MSAITYIQSVTLNEGPYDGMTNEFVDVMQDVIVKPGAQWDHRYVRIGNTRSFIYTGAVPCRRGRNQEFSRSRSNTSSTTGPWGPSEVNSWWSSLPMPFQAMVKSILRTSAKSRFGRSRNSSNC